MKLKLQIGDYMKRIAMLCLIFCGYCYSQQTESNTFVSQTAGIKVTKPSNWHFMGLDVVKENKEKIKLQDEKMQTAVRNSNAPIVAMLKYPEPYDGINPSFQLLVRPLGTLAGKTEKDLWEIILPSLEKGFKDFKLIKPAHDIIISGKTASQIMINYTLMTEDGSKYKCQSRMILWIKSGYMYQFGMGFPQKVNKEDLNEIESIVNSIEFIE